MGPQTAAWSHAVSKEIVSSCVAGMRNTICLHRYAEVCGVSVSFVRSFCTQLCWLCFVIDAQDLVASESEEAQHRSLDLLGHEAGRSDPRPKSQTPDQRVVVRELFVREPAILLEEARELAGGSALAAPVRLDGAEVGAAAVREHPQDAPGA